MSDTVFARLLTKDGFAPYGDVIETEGAQHFLINAGRCMRYHDLAEVEAAGEDARILISIVRGEPCDIPLRLGMVERHPLGSQAFFPLEGRPFLVVVCPDTSRGPGTPEAFLTRPGQGVNYRRNCWHGVLTPIGQIQDFLVVDRGGGGQNLEEFHFDAPYDVRLPEGFR